MNQEDVALQPQAAVAGDAARRIEQLKEPRPGLRRRQARAQPQEKFGEPPVLACRELQSALAVDAQAPAAAFENGIAVEEFPPGAQDRPAQQRAKHALGQGALDPARLAVGDAFPVGDDEMLHQSLRLLAIELQFVRRQMDARNEAHDIDRKRRPARIVEIVDVEIRRAGCPP